MKEGGGGDGGGMDNGGGNFGGGAQQRGGAPAAAVVPAVAKAKSDVNTPAVDPTAVVQVDGNWTYSVESPQGANGGTMKINKEGDVYSGIIISSRNNRETPLKNIKVVGNELSASYEVSFGGNTSEVLVKGIVTGDQFVGTMTMGQFGAFPMTGKRAE